MKRITFTVTNELVYDQRMQRICTTLAAAGYDVLLIGRSCRSSPALRQEPYRQRRLACVFNKGRAMYIEMNLRLFWLLLFVRADCFCAIDLDTILPNYFASVVRRKLRVYDAHELFTEQKEVVTRPMIKKIWLAVERFAVPAFKTGYTVNEFIAGEFERRYRVRYKVVRNLPVLTPLPDLQPTEKFIIYQGAVNEGRSFETLVPAMKLVDAKLVICGKGNFFEQTKALIHEYGVGDKIELRGMVLPAELKQLTPTAYAALMLFEPTGLNQYQSLANRFFDYIMAGAPQVCVNYPQYRAINDRYGVALLIDDTQPETIAVALNNLLNNPVTHKELKANCLKAREVLNWQAEEQVLRDFYRNLFI